MKLETKKDKIILVLTGSNWQTEIINEVKNNNFKVYLVDRNKDCFCKQYADKFFVHDVQDYHGLINILKNENINGILAEQTDVAVLTGAKLAKYFKIQGLDIEQAKTLTDKYYMRQFCEENKIPIPRYFCVKNVKDACAAAKDINYPVIIKPADNQSSRGVTKVWQEENIEESFNLALKFSKSNKVLVEELLIGYESSVELYVTKEKIHLLGISEKTKSFPPYSYDVKLIYPPSFSQKVTQSLIEVSNNIIKALNLKSSLVHAEYIVTPKGVYLLEIAGRGCGAGVISLLIPKITNFNPIRQRIFDCLDIPSNEPIVKNNIKTGILEFLQFPEGKVKSIDGLDNARSIRGVVDLKINFKIGDYIKYATNGAERLASLHVVGETREDAEKIAYKAKKEIRVNFE